MAKFLTTRGCSARLEEIINNARNRVVLISPFVKISDSLFSCLREANNKGVKIVLVYGKKELESDVKEQLSQLKSISVRFVENVHAKCYHNDSEMVITSMNLYDFSEINNEEMGVLLTERADELAFKEAREKANSIVNTGQEVKLKNGLFEQVAKGITSLSNSLGLNGSCGYCIRCGSSIPYNDEKSLCEKCYGKWAQYEDPTYKEKVCHKCGKPAPTSKEKPLCTACYKEAGGRSGKFPFAVAH
jgi:hypothetical protein